MDTCIFCKLGSGEIPSDKVYEDSNIIVFFDIYPVTDGHLLIIPKEHVVWMQDAKDETISQIFILAKKLMLALKSATNCDFVQVSIAGTEVPHLHVHLIPRYMNDGLANFPTKEYNKEKSKEISDKIIGAL